MDGPRFRWTSTARSDVGLVRHINEDACLALPHRGIWAVADGMGGHAFGEVASAMVVDALAALSALAPPVTMDRLAEAVRLSMQVVNHALREQALMHDVALVGSTVVVLLAIDAECTILWAGDSRAYRLRGSRLQQLTRDHSQAPLSGNDSPVAALPRQVSRGAQVNLPAPDNSLDDLTCYLLPASVGNIGSISHTAMGITRAVGATDALVLEERRFPVQDGDIFLLCSDGLSRDTDLADIARILAPGNSRHAAQSLITLALEQGGRDNISVVVTTADDPWSADRTLLNPAC